MYRYQNKAFRVLGLLPTATPVQITSRANEIKIKNSLGLQITYEYDFPWMGTLDRSEENVIHALQRLEDPVQRLKEEMFWFWVCGDSDLKALNYLRQNKKQGAHELWSRVRTENLYLNKELDTLWENDPRKAVEIDISLAFNYMDLQTMGIISEKDLDELWEVDPRQAVQAEINSAIALKKEKTDKMMWRIFSNIDKLWEEDPRQATQAEIAIALSGKYEKIDPSTISAYVNQALLAHSSVIADEEELSKKQDEIGDGHWKKWNFAISRLFLLSDSKLFWNEIYRKAKRINDPRLNNVKLEEIRNDFLSAVLEPNILFISKALNYDFQERATKHSKLLNTLISQSDLLKKCFNKAIAYQIDTINRSCDIAEQELNDIKKIKLVDPLKLIAIYSKLLDNSKRAIEYCKKVDINSVSNYCVACDKLGQVIRDIATALNNLHIGIHYKKALEMIEKAIECASSDFVKNRLEKDNRIIKGNWDNYRNRIIGVPVEDENEGSQETDESEVYYDDSDKGALTDSEEGEDSETDSDSEKPRRETQCPQCTHYYDENSKEPYEGCGLGEDSDDYEECSSFENKTDEDIDSEEELLEGSRRELICCDCAHYTPETDKYVDECLYDEDMDSNVDCEYFERKSTDETEDDELPQETHRKDPRQFELFNQDVVQTVLSDAAIYRADLQRTGFYKTKGLYRVRCLKWKASLEATSDSAISTTPIIYNGMVYVGTTNNIFYALNINSGQIKWRFKTNDSFESTAAIFNKTIFISNDSLLYAINFENGKELWTYSGGFSGRGGSPVVSNGLIMYGTGGFENHGFIALDVMTGKPKWWFPTGSMAVYSTPAVRDNIVYFGRQGFDGSYFFAVEIQTGKEIWRFYVPGINHGATIAATPIIAKDKVYFKSRNLSLYALDITSGEKAWELSRDFSDNSSPILHGNTIYACGQSFLGDGLGGTLYAVDSNTGKVLWEFKMPDNSFDGNRFSPIAADGIIYCASGTRLYALDMKTGQRIWEYEHEARVNCLTIDNGVLYLSCENTCLYALE